VVSSGLYWVEVSDVNGCTDRDSVYVASITASPQDPFLQDRIRVFPNPATEVVFVAFDLETEREAILELYSISNALILRKELQKVRSAETRIQVADLPPGSYFIRLTLDDRPYTSLLIVE
jgi:hypothetical protein